MEMGASMWILLTLLHVRDTKEPHMTSGYDCLGLHLHI